MKISILTATYNRATYLTRLYNSILENSQYEIYLEWLIMDDGSTDETRKVVHSFIDQTNNNKYLEVKYFYQNNQGKMSAINNLISYANGELLIECDSDDYFCNDSIKIISEKYNLVKDKKDIYALCFLKNHLNSSTIGDTFKSDNYQTNMFDLYFKDGITGDKALVFITSIRKQYKYKLEKDEKFCTEARMYNEMDKFYDIICFNNPIMICQYLEEGYSKNIKNIFLQNPYAYYEYFKQLLTFDMKNVLFAKRIYIIKHYILFCYLTRQKYIFKNVRGFFNKFLIFILYIPGIVKSYKYTKK